MKRYVYIMIPKSGLGYIQPLSEQEIWGYLNKHEDVSNIIKQDNLIPAIEYLCKYFGIEKYYLETSIKADDKRGTLFSIKTYDFFKTIKSNIVNQYAKLIRKLSTLHDTTIENLNEIATEIQNSLFDVGFWFVFDQYVFRPDVSLLKYLNNIISEEIVIIEVYEVKL